MVWCLPTTQNQNEYPNRDTQELEAEQKKPIVQDEYGFRQAKEKALNDGYTQGEIARYLDLYTAMISRIFRASGSG